MQHSALQRKKMKTERSINYNCYRALTSLLLCFSSMTKIKGVVADDPCYVNDNYN